MAKVQTSHEKAVKTAVKKRNKKKKNAPSSQDVQMVFCILCRRSYLKHEGQDHMHSMLHHRELETVLDKNSFHECQACQEISMSLNEYARHISTAQHKFKLKRLISKNVKPASLYKTLGNKTVTQILDRNKTLKMRHKKEKNKERKKRRQLAGQGRAEEMQQGAAKKKTVRNSERVSTRILKNMQQSHVEGSNSAAVQNKRNEVSSQQRPAYQRESTLQLESDRWAWQQPFVHDQFNQSTHRLRYFGSQCSEDKFKKPQTERHVRNVHNIQVGVTDMSEHITWPAISQQDQCNEPCDSETEFTSDLLPQNGALIFDHSSHESRGSSQSGKEGSRCSAQPASANRSSSAAPIRDVDISVMLRQIRRSLGVREPCRADREARKQNSEAGIWLADKAGAKKVQPECSSFRNSASFRGDQSITTSGRSSLFNSSDPASHSGVRRSNVDPAKPKHAGVQMSQGTTQQCEKSSVVACDSNRPSNSRERESAGAFGNHTSHSRCSGGAASSETNLTITRRVRIAHRRSTVQGDNEFRLSPTLNNSLSSPGAQRKLSWREMYEGMRRKKQEKGKNIPRFGIELANPPSHQESSTQADYLPLSEGFHWESVPDSPAGPQWTTLPPAPLDTADTESHTETQSDSQIQEPLEPPGAAQEAYSSQKLEALPVKGEPNLKDENEELRNHSNPKKRKHKVQTHEDISDEKPRGKKKKSKSNMDDDQIDQLLAVSLREEELSHSLQDLDQSLIQARSTLQAAYAEVQRLLLLAQQFTAEVNSLRVKRIEILQGMQEGYSVESPTRASEEPTTSSSAFPTAAQPRDSPIPSSNSQQPLPTNPVSSISQLYPTQFTLETAPVMPLLLTSSLAAPPADATFLKQQEKVTKAELQDCEKTTRLARGGADAVSEGGNPRPAAESPFVCEKDQPGDDGGNKNDSSFRMIEPSNLVVINIDESDNEETASDVRTQQDPLQTSVSVEVNPATTQQNDAERKAEPTLTPVEDATASPACAVAAEDEEPSVGAFEKHTGPVYGLQVHEGLLYTCSGDNAARAHSLTTRECQAVFKGHTNKVNCLLVSSPPSMAARLFTGSSDQTIRCYSLKTQKCLEQISLSDSVLCLHAAWNILFAGLANGSVASHDLKTLKRLDVFECHGPRGVSCLGTAQEGARRVLLVGSYDSTISVRDAKSSLLLRSLEGHTKTVLCMTVVNDLVFSGSSDTSVHAHNIHTGELIRVYKGHSHGVTSVAILGNVMVTACLDKLVRVYELQSHNCLQVYGGHSGMVMCMAVHKSVMYTGCLDGSVQAVKLDLMNNYHCWWQNCPLIFGVAEHLVEHIVGDHTNPNSESVKCRWRGCSTFFATQQSVKQELPEHMQSHVKNAREVQL